MKRKSVQSINPFKSVIQTMYDIVKAHGGELKVETNYTGADGENMRLHTGESGTAFIIQLPNS